MHGGARVIDDQGIRMSAVRRDPELSAATELSSMMSAPDPSRVAIAMRWGRIIAWVVTAIGLLAVAGWISGFHEAAMIVPNTTPMSFAAAVSFACLGFVFGTSHNHSSQVVRWTRVILMSLVASWATNNLIASVTGYRRSRDIWQYDPSHLNGEMPLLLTLTFLFLTTAALFEIPGRTSVSQWLVLPALGIGVITASAVIYDPHALQGVVGLEDLSVLSPFALVILALSMMMQTSDTGFVALGMGNTEGSDLVRKLLPRAAVALLLGMFIGFQFYVSGVTSRALGFGIGSGLIILVGGFLVWFQAARFHAVDMRRLGAEHVVAQVREALAERDAMARRLGASQQRLRRVLDTSVDAYIAIDESGSVTEWNDAATAMFGWTYSEAINTPLDTLIIPADQRSEHRNGIFRFLTTGEGRMLEVATELTGVRKDGTPVEIELKVWAIKDRGQTNFHAFIRDVTDRKRAQRELERANRELEEFAAVAAHDLRSPLVAISLTAELIAQQESQAHSDSTVDWANRIIDATKRGNDLINDLLTLSQITRAPKDFELVDTDELVRDLAQEALSTTKRGGKVDVGLLPEVWGDRVLLRQLFSNLVTNALKYVPDDREPVVRVHADRTPAGDLHFVVTDNGDGIPEEDLAAIFDMFHRGSNSVGSTGSGIGLAICRRVAEHHGGTIHVSNSDEGGALFDILLPPPLPSE